MPGCDLGMIGLGAMGENLALNIERNGSSVEVYHRTAVELGIPCLAFSASLGDFDAYRADRLPADLTQAQRDHFGAHTYRRTDKEGTFHTEWKY